MTTKFTTHISLNFPFLLKAKVLVAVSGGVDSVVLTHLLNKMGVTIGLAHVNFQLRGEESDLDALFVENLAKSLAVPIFTHRIDTTAYAKLHKQSIQVAARNIRYNWFSNLLKSEHFDYVLTAHHADDALETFIINLNRSTGLSGLTGIPSNRNHIVRPLLNFSRNQIEAYAVAHQLKWREDASNKSTKYLRNSIRHQIIPVLKEVLPNFDSTFKQTQQYLRQSEALVESYIALVKPKIWKEKGDSITLSISVLKSLPHTKAVLYELLKDYGFKEWNVICKLLDAQSGKRVYAKDYFLLKDRSFLVLGVIDNADLKPYQIGIGDHLVISNKNKATQEYKVFFYSSLEMEDITLGKPDDIFLDAANIVLPFTVRNWKKGDYFYPLGMKGKKKISDFLIDQKIPIHQKEKIQLLCDSNGNVVWVIGKRIDNRYRITKQTRQIIRIKK